MENTVRELIKGSDLVVGETYVDGNYTDLTPALLKLVCYDNHDDPLFKFVGGDLTGYFCTTGGLVPFPKSKFFALAGEEEIELYLNKELL